MVFSRVTGSDRTTLRRDRPAGAYAPPGVAYSTRVRRLPVQARLIALSRQHRSAIASAIRGTWRLAPARRNGAVGRARHHRMHQCELELHTALRRGSDARAPPAPGADRDRAGRILDGR